MHRGDRGIAMLIPRSAVALVLSLGLIHGVSIHALTGAPGEVALTVEAGGLVSLEAYINGAGPFRLLLDTGSSASSVSRKLMRTLQLALVGTGDLVTPSGTRARDGVRLDVVSVGAASRRSLLAHVIDNRDLAALGPDVDGILGQDFLVGQHYTVDYRRKRLSWRADTGGDAPAGATLDLKFEQGRWLAGLPQTDGRVLWFVPDSGAAALVLYDRGCAAALKTRIVSCCAGVTTVNGSGSARLVIVPEFKVGARVIRNREALILNRAHAHSPTGDGLLPLSMFASVSFHPQQQVLRVRF